MNSNSFGWTGENTILNISGYNTIQDEGVSLPQRTILDFQGAGVTVTDNGLKTIVTIPSSIGFFSQTANSTPVTNTINELTLIDGGVGTLTVPANGFSVGDAFKVNMAGNISAQNNTTLRIRVKSGAVVLGDSGLITMPNITNKFWNFDINFVIRAIGTAGVASICSSGIFTYSKNASNTFDGNDFVTIQNTSFDTTISNTLNITAQWGAASVLDSIYTSVFNLYKIF